MVFATTIIEQFVMGPKKVVRGTWSTDANGGNIATGLTTCEELLLTYSTTTLPSPATVTTALPAAGSSITVNVSINSGGRWIAIGY